MKRILVSGATLAIISTVAWAFPWDIDMVDTPMFKAYEWEMLPTPEGSVSQNHYRDFSIQRGSPEGEALVNPIDGSNPALLKQGEKMFNVYCTACHGPEGVGGAPVAEHDPASQQYRYPLAPPPISGDSAATKLRSDGYLFLTMRNGGSLMPSYSFAMSDEELWSVVTYIRTLPGAARL